MRILLIAIAMLAGSAGQAAAWGDDGHRAICHMAFNMLTNTARTEVIRLIALDGEYTNFIDACTDEDNEPRPRRDGHFLNLPRNRLAVESADCFAMPICVVSVINGDLVILRTGAQLDRAHALKSLGHWVGDIHQPLHVSYEDDRGGNKIRNCGVCASGDLHAVWDSCIPGSFVFGFTARDRPDPAEKDAKIFAAADSLAAAITPADKALWSANADPVRWAAESYAITLDPDVKYCVRRGNACWYSAQRRTYSARAPRSVAVDWDYITTYGPTVKTRMSQAAVRMAHMLNGALDPAYPPPR